MKKKRSGIYCIENLINGKKYFGQSYDIDNRVRDNHKNSIALNNAISKYGKDSFKKYILLLCEKEELDYYEIECIHIFQSLSSEHGYNILKGGKAGRRGIKTPDDVKKKISKSGKGKKRSLIARKNISNAKLGNKNPQYGKRGKDSPNYNRKNSPAIKRNGTSSIYYGVHKRKDREKSWVTRITINGKLIYIGTYMTELEAAQAWDKYIIKNKLTEYPLNL
jgi:group I intron endonuclease